MSRRALRFGTLVCACLIVLTTGAGRAYAAFGLEPGSFIAKAHQVVPLEHVGGGPLFEWIADVPALREATPLSAAGAHPDATASFAFNRDGSGVFPEDEVKDAVVGTPPGFIGNPTSVPSCPRDLMAAVSGAHQSGLCPPSSQVGVVTVTVNTGFGHAPQTHPLYRVTETAGTPAQFAFVFAKQFIILTPHLDSDGDYGLEFAATDIAANAPVLAVTVTLWGVPASPVHDPERWNYETGDFGAPAGLTPAPFIINPTWCDSGELQSTIEIDSWQESGRWLPVASGDPNYTAAAPQPTGCGSLRFAGGHGGAGLTLQPTVRSADTPSGYEANLTLPYNENPNGLANPTLRDTKVTLPEGVALNPSAANGLAACTEAQIGYLGNGFPMPNPIHFDEEPIGCPDASKIGTVEIVTPLLEEPLKGAVYLARQDENPFGSLLAIYIAIDDAKTGIVVKLAGHVETDPTTGRITATFANNPQLPFTEFKLDFFGGPGASLVNPQTCGTKTTSTVLTPWSAPYTPAVTSTDSFQVESGANGAACPATEAQAPNAPTVEAGTTFTNAGLYSPFVLKLSREDGSQRLSGLDVSLPPGLTGKLAGIPYCSEAQIAQALSRDKPGDGALEQASPSCPAASQIGTVNVGAGAGSQPYYVQGKAYLAGPYKGAPLSMVIVTPAVAGPFDLGVVVVRTALYVDPETAKISAKSDPLPTILEGIPLDVRSIAVSLDRPGGFTLNPTNCEAMAITGQAVSTTGNVASLHNRFQVGGCKGLEFAPQLKLQLKGATKRVGHPALKAVVTYPKGGEYANIARAQVNLPHGEFLDQGNLNKTCTRPVLLAGNCPATSVYGKAKAWTPLLERPLEGPVYLVGGYGYKLPALVAELNGQIKVLLVGKVDSGKNKGIRNTFEVVPDAPVSRFVLEMKGGKKYGLLENSENLCKASKEARQAIVRFTGQNGKVDHYKPVVANQCGKQHPKKHKGQQRQKAG